MPRFDLEGSSCETTGVPEDSTDDPEFETLLQRHISGLQAFMRLRANRDIRNHESFSDLVQSVCREVLDGADKFEYQGDAQFKSWLYTTALRKIVQRDRYYRSQKRDVRRKLSPNPDDSAGVLDAYATLSTPSMHLNAKEQMQSLEQAFDQLTEDQREVLTLHKIAGLSHAEIAAQTGRAEDACRQLLRRAMVRLSIILDAEEN